MSYLIQVNKAKAKRRFEEIDTEPSDNEQTERPKLKLLRKITTASGLFVEEPMTPEKQNKFGFNGEIRNFKFQK